MTKKKTPRLPRLLLLTSGSHEDFQVSALIAVPRRFNLDAALTEFAVAAGLTKDGLWPAKWTDVELYRKLKELQIRTPAPFQRPQPECAFVGWLCRHYGVQRIPYKPENISRRGHGLEFNPPAKPSKASVPPAPTSEADESARHAFD